MMTRKIEMAEWILDFFRRGMNDTGQMVMMHDIQNSLHDLTPKERDLFIPVANELIANGYFTYEQGKFQSLRLTKKGRDYIYTPSAKLDCCYDNKHSPIQAQYIDSWHQNFVAYVKQLKGVIATLMLMPEATEEDKRVMASFQLMLDTKDVQEIEEKLSKGNVSKDVLEKVSKLNKNLVDAAVERINTDILSKEFLKQLAYLKIEQDRKGEEMRLKILNLL